MSDLNSCGCKHGQTKEKRCLQSIKAATSLTTIRLCLNAQMTSSDRWRQSSAQKDSKRDTEDSAAEFDDILRTLSKILVQLGRLGADHGQEATCRTIGSSVNESEPSRHLDSGTLTQQWNPESGCWMLVPAHLFGEILGDHPPRPGRGNFDNVEPRSRHGWQQVLHGIGNMLCQKWPVALLHLSQLPMWPATRFSWPPRCRWTFVCRRTWIWPVQTRSRPSPMATPRSPEAGRGLSPTSRESRRSCTGWLNDKIIQRTHCRTGALTKYRWSRKKVGGTTRVLQWRLGWQQKNVEKV